MTFAIPCHLLDNGHHVWRPAAVEAEGHANRQADRRDGLAGEVLSIQDHDVAEVALRVVDIGQHPALVFRDGARLADEDRLRRSCSYVHERRAWLFAGSALAGQRAAIVMSLVQSAKLHGHDPWAYLNDVLTRLPTQLNGRIDELHPHNWQASR